MHKITAAAAATLVWLLGSVEVGGFAAASLGDQVRELLRTRIEASGVAPRITVGRESIHASVMLPRFYERRTYRPGWIGEDGSPRQIDALVQAVQEADREGLRPDDYHLEQITALLSRAYPRGRISPRDLGTLVDLDLLLTDAFLIYASHLSGGRVNPVTFDPEWHANREERELAEFLATAIESDRVEAALGSLLPSDPRYAGLRKSLADYREVAANGGWPAVPEGSKLQKGSRGAAVAALRVRLRTTGNLVRQRGLDPDLFDEEVEAGVRRFQELHGLDVDGVVGRATLAALNVPVESRIRQIELNMERWRWLPRDLEGRYLVVNIAGFDLDVVENRQAVMTMRVVVGRHYRRTPVFTDKMTYLVLSPYWNITPNMAVRDNLPRIRKDPDYFAKENITVLQGWGADTREIDPKTVDWSKVTPGNFSYRLRQQPGPANALGRVKFMFPNRFNVYLHDTPSRELFTKAVRTFSSGCIRVERPIELAEYLLRGSPGWTRERILSEINKWTERTVRIPEPIPVYILYWTAWVSQDGSLQFRHDIYGRDQKLDRALSSGPPAP